MVNQYFELTNYQGEDYQEYISQQELIHIFEPIFVAFPNKMIAKGIIKFILYGYSIESDMLTTSGNTWSKVAIDIYDKCDLPQDRIIYDMVIGLKNTAMITCIDKWLEYQNEENFQQWVTYRDLRSQMLSSALSDIKKATSETDFEQKMKNAVHSQTLLQMMNQAKDTFIQNHNKLKASVATLNKVKTSDKNSRNPASYAVR